MQDELGIPIKWGGSLEWFDSSSRQEKLVSQIAEQIAWGEPAKMLPRDQLSALEPNVDFSTTLTAAFSGNDGAIDPVLATHALLKAAEAYGALVKYPCELLDLSMTDGRLQAAETSMGKIPADKIILATGAAPEMAKRFADSHLPQRTTPGVIAITKPMPKILNRLISAPGVHMHQRLDGRIVLGEQHGPPNNEAHATQLKDRPVMFPAKELADQHFARILEVAIKFLPNLARAEPEAVHIGWRPLPLDGHPVLGFSENRPDIYLAIMHSAVSLAPIIGQLVAQEVITNTPIEKLSAYRPDRTFENIKRY